MVRHGSRISIRRPSTSRYWRVEWRLAVIDGWNLLSVEGPLHSAGGFSTWAEAMDFADHVRREYESVASA